MNSDIGRDLLAADRHASIRPLTPESLRAAALTTCHYAETTDDARELLAALGLLEAVA